VRWLALKELSVGALNGLVWAVVALVAYVWLQDMGIAAASVLNLLAATISGISIPSTACPQRQRIRPGQQRSVP